ncbi:hypothetical protein [Tenacibaculum sp. Bg11-29]|nr:hypothetical protein [Tenacibaculum sp. Bg11-29]
MNEERVDLNSYLFAEKLYLNTLALSIDKNKKIIKAAIQIIKGVKCVL